MSSNLDYLLTSLSHSVFRYKDNIVAPLRNLASDPESYCASADFAKAVDKLLKAMTGLEWELARVRTGGYSMASLQKSIYELLTEMDALIAYREVYEDCKSLRNFHMARSCASALKDYLTKVYA